MTIEPRNTQEIRELVQGRVEERVLLGRLTSFRIGGPADLLVEPADNASLARLIRYLREEKIPKVILGAGTNVLFHDDGFRGVVIRTGSLSGLDFREEGPASVIVTVAAGAPLPALVSRACKLGWTGLEALWGIPGSFGGAIASNAGAGEVSVGDRLVSIRLLTALGDETVLNGKDLRHEYRSIELPEDSVVIEGAVRLPSDDPRAIEANLEAAKARRKGKQPWDQRSAGCVFKNPSADNPAGAIIDRLGLKGLSVGDAEVSRLHANFIINRGKARAADVLELIEIVRAKVKEEKGIELTLEIRVLGGGASGD